MTTEKAIEVSIKVRLCVIALTIHPDINCTCISLRILQKKKKWTKPGKMAGITVAAPPWKYLVQMFGRFLALSSDSYACPLALLLCVKAVCVAAAAAIPELSTGVGLFVVVPTDVVVTACALVKHQVTARV